MKNKIIIVCLLLLDISLSGQGFGLRQKYLVNPEILPQMLSSIFADKKTAAGCPTTDSFTASNGTALATYSSCWSSLVQSQGDVAHCEIQSNEVRPTGDGQVCATMYNLASDTASITFTPFTDGNFHKKICVSAGLDSGSDKSGYCALFSAATGGNWTAMDVVKAGGAYGFFCTVTGTVSQASNATVKIVRSGTTTVTVTVSVNGTPWTGTCSDTSGTRYGTGNPGFGVSGDFSGTTLLGMDDFSTL